MKRYRLFFGFVLISVAAFLIGQAAPNACITPEMIAPQGEGSGLDSDTVDGQHASELEGEGAGSIHVINANGESVGMYIQQKDRIMFDPSLGVVYRVDFWSGDISASHSNVGKYYESTDCTGDWYAYDQLEPFDTFTVYGDSNVYLTTAVGNRTIRSEKWWDTCDESAPMERRVGITLTTVTLPGPFPAPLYLEAR